MGLTNKSSVLNNTTLKTPLKSRMYFYILQNTIMNLNIPYHIAKLFKKKRKLKKIHSIMVEEVMGAKKYMFEATD